MRIILNLGIEFNIIEDNFNIYENGIKYLPSLYQHFPMLRFTLKNMKGRCPNRNAIPVGACQLPTPPSQFPLRCPNAPVPPPPSTTLTPARIYEYWITKRNKPCEVKGPQSENKESLLIINLCFLSVICCFSIRFSSSYQT